MGLLTISALESSVSIPAYLYAERKVSAAGSALNVSSSAASMMTVTAGMRSVPPLATALQGLYLGENNLADESLHVLMIFRELRVLNLSFNEIQEMPRSFFRA